MEFGPALSPDYRPPSEAELASRSMWAQGVSNDSLLPQVIRSAVRIGDKVTTKDGGSAGVVVNMIRGTGPYDWLCSVFVLSQQTTQPKIRNSIKKIK